MDQVKYHLEFEKLSSVYQLGPLMAEPVSVTGGFLHRMFKMTTAKGRYAVKALNPQIMQRTTAMSSFIFSEKVAALALQQGIDTIPAIISNGSCMHEVEGQHYLLFPWMDGSTLPSGVVDLDCCTKMGRVLAKLHRADFAELVECRRENHKQDASKAPLADWRAYALMGKQEGLPWYNMLTEHTHLLLEWELLADKTGAKLRNNRVISHRDLDLKNVLWNKGHTPVLIDWEAAGAIHPTQEMLEVALYWSGAEAGNASKEAFCTIIETYRSEGGTVGDNALDALNYGFRGKLDWLSYNIRRSLGLECADASEQELGTDETVKTLQSLIDYAEWIPVYVDWLSELGIHKPTE
ncbi:phosphotransferase [Paenibacillus vulneris]|uniref:Phosphotransferase n=1 Tax=Paenibacillus vulneris TaxID=1133364 RepID=A0ABW3UNI7_9BACL